MLMHLSQVRLFFLLVKLVKINMMGNNLMLQTAPRLVYSLHLTWKLHPDLFAPSPVT